MVSENGIHFEARFGSCSIGQGSGDTATPQWYNVVHTRMYPDPVARRFLQCKQQRLRPQNLKTKQFKCFSFASSLILETATSGMKME